MASESGRGGSRHLSGRRPDPIRDSFETIRTPANLAKPAQQQQTKCKSCAETVVARAERMRDHREKCQHRFQVNKS